jgi:hypothetical protein
VLLSWFAIDFEIELSVDLFTLAANFDAESISDTLILFNSMTDSFVDSPCSSPHVLKLVVGASTRSSENLQIRT